MYYLIEKYKTIDLNNYEFLILLNVVLILIWNSLIHLKVNIFFHFNYHLIN
jgi:hypothetical protein